MHNHEHTIIHGDLKSVSKLINICNSTHDTKIYQNNVLMRRGKVYLCDFGLSRLLDGVSGQSSDLHCNARWAAPELLTFRNGTSTKPSCETDMYSFGSVFLEVRMSIVSYNLAGFLHHIWCISLGTHRGMALR